MIKHTEGPFYKTGEEPPYQIRQRSTDYVVAQIVNGGHINDNIQLIDDETIEANADLFAAAPEMLAVVIEAMNVISRVPGNSTLRDLVCKLNDVAAKASPE